MFEMMNCFVMHGIGKVGVMDTRCACQADAVRRSPQAGHGDR